MAAPTSSQLARWTAGRWLRSHQSPSAGRLVIDARDMEHGGVFVALKTGKRDGHEFVAQAAANGAAMAIVEHGNMRLQLPQLVVEDTLDALHKIGTAARREFKGRVTAITGSCGKTSTKELLTLLLGDNVLCTRGNLNNYIGLPITLSRLANSDYASAVVEVGISMTGEMTPLAKMAAPDEAIVTCVAPAHLAGLGSIEGVAAEKCVLPASVARSGKVFFPADCLKYAPFRELAATVYVTAAMDEETPVLPGPNYRLVRHQVFRSTVSEKSELLVFMPGAANFARFTLPHLSSGMRSNAVLAIAAALESGVGQGEIAARLGDWRPSSMRGEIFLSGGLSWYLDCYNANPASMLDAVRNFRECFPRERHLLLLGCMNELGPDSGELHRALGKAIGLAQAERFCILGAQAEDLARGLAEAGVPSSKILAAKERAEIRAALDNFAGEPGAVFIKGSRSYRMEEFAPESPLK
jgi:UDP-N-acetylmuramoyl-tripeptide--D-alanyl-D-alanine ligase